MKEIVFLSIVVIVLGCNANSGRSTNERKDTGGTNMKDVRSSLVGEAWGNISIDTAKQLIRTFCQYSDALNEKNATKSVWFRRSEIHESFNKIFEKVENNLNSDVDYDGYRIYFARYPLDWGDAEKRGQNTIVITRTRSSMLNNASAHEDILEINKVSGIYVQPLNDGGRCRPNCNGVLLLDSIYTIERMN